jgi:hypothetical protein
MFKLILGVLLFTIITMVVFINIDPNYCFKTHIPDTDPRVGIRSKSSCYSDLTTVTLSLNLKLNRPD